MLGESSTIAVVAPAGIPKLDGLERGMALLREWGYRIIEGEHVRDRHLFNAGTAAARTADLVWALTDPEIDAVWLARGGYGCVHCLPALRGERLLDRPVIGCSDATSLFSALLAGGHTRLVHGPMLETLATGVDDATRARVRALLSSGPLGPIAGRHLCGPRAPVAGRLAGGNLCVLASLAGTPWALRAAGAILVLEDIGEAAYRIDRLITQLRWSGALDGVAGVALGDFVSCAVPAGALFSLEEVLEEALAPLGVPVVVGLPIGHGRTNLAWRLGQPAQIRDGSLCFDVPAC
jgi:muramoyltetrapeptide carboxypeptidase